MKNIILLCLFLGLATPVAGTKASPVQQVIKLLQDMVKTGEEEKHAEQVQFAKFKTWCDNQFNFKNTAIAEAEEAIDRLKADIKEHEATIERLAREIAAHQADIECWEGDKKASTAVHELEKSDFEAMNKDYSESVSALVRAIAVLKKQPKKRKQSKATTAAPETIPGANNTEPEFLELKSLRNLKLIPDNAKRTIEIFLQQDGPEDAEAEGLEIKNPEAHGYEFQSNGVIEMLEELHTKFVAERTALNKKEQKRVSAYKQLMQDLNNQIEYGTADEERKTNSKNTHKEKKTQAEKDLSDTTLVKDDDVQFRSDLVATCEQKASDFDTRQNLRAEELVAVNKAIEILSSNDVAGNAATLMDFTQVSSLAQLRSGLIEKKQQDRAASYLRARAAELKSHVLMSVATHAVEDPFVKVKKLIQDLITKLMQQATEETEHKGWCDTELGTNAQTRETKTKKVETLHAEIDQLDASTAKLGEDIAKLSSEVAELDAALVEATKNRAEEKETNQQTIKDANTAQVAVAQALTVLKEFYAKAAESTAFVQAPDPETHKQPEAPEIFDKPYRGMGAQNGGVVGMIEVIQSDYARLVSDTEAAEQKAEEGYKTLKHDTAVDKAAKTTDIENKEAQKKDQAASLAEKMEDVEGTQKELDAALAYFEKLKPSCIDTGVTFEDRSERRKEEIESLQQALQILNGQAIA